MLWRQHCARHPVTSAVDASCYAVQALPDLRDAKWQDQGLQAVPSGLHAGVMADCFVWSLTEDQGYGVVHANYTFYVSKVALLLLICYSFACQT